MANHSTSLHPLLVNSRSYGPGSRVVAYLKPNQFPFHGVTTEVPIGLANGVSNHLRDRRSLPPPPRNSVMFQESRYKTELCRQFIELGQCHYGDRCLFAHGGYELKDIPHRHPKFKTEPFIHSTETAEDILKKMFMSIPKMPMPVNPIKGNPMASDMEWPPLHQLKALKEQSMKKEGMCSINGDGIKECYVKEGRDRGHDFESAYSKGDLFKSKDDVQAPNTALTSFSLISLWGGKPCVFVSPQEDRLPIFRQICPI